MKKLTSLIIFVGLAINVSGQDQPKNLKEAFKADWLIGTWERKNDNGQVDSHTFGWKIQDVLMFKEYKADGVPQAFAIISLDTDEDMVKIQSYSARGTTSTGEMKAEGDKVTRKSNWKTNKLSEEEVKSRMESIVANQLASGAVKKEGVPELKQNIRKYYQRTSGTREYTYVRQGKDKMVMTRLSKTASGQLGGNPVIYTRKKE